MYDVYSALFGIILDVCCHTGTGTCGIAAVPGHGQATSAGAGLRCATLGCAVLRWMHFVFEVPWWTQTGGFRCGRGCGMMRDADVRHAWHIALWCTCPWGVSLQENEETQYSPYSADRNPAQHLKILVSDLGVEWMEHSCPCHGPF